MNERENEPAPEIQQAAAPSEPASEAETPNESIVAPTYETLLGTEAEPTIMTPEYLALENEDPESKY